MSAENSETEKPDSGTKLESGQADVEVKEPETSEVTKSRDGAAGPGTEEARKNETYQPTGAESAGEQPSNTAGSPTAAGECTSTPVAPKVAPAPKTVPAKGLALSRFWWLLASFLLPFGILLLYLAGQSAVSWKLCARSGFVGLGLALVIYGLWKIDNKISGSRNMDVSSQLLVRMLGMMLWLVWVGASHVILLATDEIFPPLDLS